MNNQPRLPEVYHAAMTLTTRQRLRAEVFELADTRCEHPAATGRCPNRAVQMAHIFPRGMGHTGYSDHLANVMAACPVHARSTDDLSSPEWNHVVEAQRAADLNSTQNYILYGSGSFNRRIHLTNYVNTRRRRDGWDV